MAYSGAPQTGAAVSFSLVVATPGALTRMTLDEMIQLCRDLTGDPAGTGRTPVEWRRLINLEAEEFIKDAPLCESEETFIVAAGDDGLWLPETFIATPLPAVFRESGSQVDLMASRDVPAVRRRGAVCGFALVGLRIQFDAQVDAATPFIVRWSRLPRELVHGTDVLDFDREFHKAVCFRAAVTASWADGEAGRAQYLEPRAAKLLRRAQEAVNARYRSRRRRDDE